MDSKLDQYMAQKAGKTKKTESRITERLIQNRTILISTDINDEVVDRVIKNLILMEQEDANKPVDVYIRFPGRRRGFRILRFMTCSASSSRRSERSSPGYAPVRQ